MNLVRAYAGASDLENLSRTVGHLSSANYADQALLKNLATLLAGAGASAAVAELWQAALHHDPNQPLPYAALAELWIGQGQSAKALALLDGAPAAARGPLVLYAAADAQMAVRNYDKAIPLLAELTRGGPDDPGPWRKLVTCDLLTGRLTEAEEAASQAARKFPGVSEFPYQQAVADYMLKRVAVAISTLAPLVEKPGGSDPRPVLLMAVLQAQIGQYQEAAGYFERAEKMETGCNALASYFYGATLLRMHQPPEAQAQLEAAIRCHPRFALAEFRLGEALSQQGKLPEAAAALEQSTRDDPSLAEPYYALAGSAAGRATRQARARRSPASTVCKNEDPSLIEIWS